jgi:RNA polymerase sigma factor (sigma-70 family)
LLEQFTDRRSAAAEAAFEGLVRRHGPMVLRVCRNALPRSDDIEDAFQATFLVLVRRSRSIRRLESVGSWLLGVASRIAARTHVESARRRKAERRAGLRLVRTMHPDQATAAEDEDFSRVVQEELRRLPDKYRSVVLLCYWEGLTQEQAAAQLGCPLGTVRSHLARARDFLRRRLTRRGLAPLAVATALEGSPAQAAPTASRLRPVPSHLVHSTMKAVVQVVVGQATARVVSGVAARLVRRPLWGITMIKLARTLVPLVFGALAVLSVTLWAHQSRKDRSQSRPRPRPQIARENVPPTAAARGRYAPAHVVEPPDMLLVEVLEALPGRPISGERLVRPDGAISLDFYGEINVAGLTLPEIKETIIHHLRRFLTDEALRIVDVDPATAQPRVDPETNKPILLDPKRSATVFVDVTAWNSKNYYVEGEVYEPGRLPVSGNESVLDAVHFAGGILPSADRSKIRLMRSYPKRSAVQALPVDYDEITMGT